MANRVRRKAQREREKVQAALKYLQFLGVRLASGKSEDWDCFAELKDRVWAL